ncbi:hypothetical protein PHLGIDRAFT_231714 [Phlebiopsis gigantea 11061_1 CR5-6]|uniref:Methyltransferase-domain-containing protein n=1 Tax=Phlebiopsis gigantea (strain 11061_1 CR5-6) TaxID=745531 RepID=A0A0C3SC04_PHLG1|nr:hypothetical protein PHLGIDRAFT_231714 [Phlebiopsis gigantea 11061_1 CR5-6]
MAPNPNFPTNLDIKPSHYSDDRSTMYSFDFAAQEEAIREYGIAGRVWEASFLINTYISGPSDTLFDPPFVSPEDEERHLTILELGSGTGIVAAQCMKRLSGKSATIIATDLPEVCPLLQKNLHTGSAAPEALAGPTLLIRPLSWGDHHHASAILDDLRSAPSDREPPDAGPRVLSHIVCSDLVYFPELLAPLLRSLLQLSRPPFAGPAARVVLAYKTRSLAKEAPFWAALLGGVGARGDSRCKGDDTFETLLLMGMLSGEQ